VTVPMPTMPTAITPEFGARTVMVVMVTHVVAALLDHDGLGARNRRRRDNERAKRGDNESKLLHSNPPQLSEDKTSHRGGRSCGT
jgi:hypothetical protein